MNLAHAPTLYLLCGKIAAGKSTLARRLAARPATLLISEDHWTSNLFADDLKTIEDFTNYFVAPGPGEGFNVVVHTA
jgi:deoxyadenosine/deoxycytidine kinase